MTIDKDLNYDRRDVGWINCPNGCGRAVSLFSTSDT